MHPEFFEDEMLSLATLALVLTVVSIFVYFTFMANPTLDRKQPR